MKTAMSLGFSMKTLNLKMAKEERRHKSHHHTCGTHLNDDDDETRRRTMTTALLPEKLQTLRGFKVSKILNDGKDSSFGNVVAVLGTFPGLEEEDTLSTP